MEVLLRPTVCYIKNVPKTTMTNKTLYVETDSLEFKEARETGVLRVIIGDAEDTDVRAGQYKGKRRQQFFSFWDIKHLRDHAVHDQLKRLIFADRATYVSPDGDVQSREVFDFNVETLWSEAEMKQQVIRVITEAVENVNGEVKQQVQFIPTTWQRRAIEFIAEALQAGKMTLLLELAARFGKTGTITQLFSYSDADVMVVTNYVKTVNGSFGDTAVKYFADQMSYLDASESDFVEKLQAEREAGRKVLVTCSLFKGAKTDRAIEALTKIDNRLVVVDEADFGAHTESNRQKVDTLRQGSPLILMTGTNADRAASSHDVDAHMSTTYFDMLMEVAS